LILIFGYDRQVASHQPAFGRLVCFDSGELKSGFTIGFALLDGSQQHGGDFSSLVGGDVEVGFICNEEFFLLRAGFPEANTDIVAIFPIGFFEENLDIKGVIEQVERHDRTSKFGIRLNYNGKNY
jgi:hypothetical protein